MQRGQGSLEYLLILAAILAIAVVVVLVANSMLAPGEQAANVAEDKYNAALVGLDLGDYDTPYDGNSNTGPTNVNYKGKDYDVNYKTDDEIPDTAKKIASIGSSSGGGSYSVYYDEDNDQIYIEQDPPDDNDTGDDEVEDEVEDEEDEEEEPAGCDPECGVNTPYCSEGACVQCTENSHCSDAHVCTNNQCMDKCLGECLPSMLDCSDGDVYECTYQVQACNTWDLKQDCGVLDCVSGACVAQDESFVHLVEGESFSGIDESPCWMNILKQSDHPAVSCASYNYKCGPWGNSNNPGCIPAKEDSQRRITKTINQPLEGGTYYMYFNFYGSTDHSDKVRVILNDEEDLSKLIEYDIKTGDSRWFGPYEFNNIPASDNTKITFHVPLLEISNRGSTIDQLCFTTEDELPEDCGTMTFEQYIEGENFDPLPVDVSGCWGVGSRGPVEDYSCVSNGVCAAMANTRFCDDDKKTISEPASFSTEAGDYNVFLHIGESDVYGDSAKVLVSVNNHVSGGQLVEWPTKDFGTKWVGPYTLSNVPASSGTTTLSLSVSEDSQLYSNTIIDGVCLTNKDYVPYKCEQQKS